MTLAKTRLSFQPRPHSSAIFTLVFDSASCLVELELVGEQEWRGWLQDRSLLADKARLTSEFSCALIDPEGERYECLVSLQLEGHAVADSCFGSGDLRAFSLTCQSLSLSPHFDSEPQLLRT